MALVLSCVAIAGPALLPIGAPPMISLYTEAAALLGWGIWLAWLLPRMGGNPLMPNWSMEQAELVAALAVLGLSLLGLTISMVFLSLPVAIGLRQAAILFAAIVTLLAGARLPGALSSPAGDVLARAVLLAFLLAGLGNAAICALQYFGVDGPWERLGNDGRAGGNLAQPNLLGTQVLWAYVALVALVAQGYLGRALAWACAVSLIAAMAFSASRSAAVASVVLVLWGLLDRRLGRDARRLLIVVPVMLMLAWWGLEAWHHLGGRSFAGSELMQKADPSSSRWRLWQQCARLVAAHPWAGVGWGQFNFAWTLTPMPGLPRTAGYTFTHAHNIAVHWAVELGLPFAIAMVGLTGYAVLRAANSLWRDGGEAPVIRRAAVAMVMVILVHSQFEFPLWHTNFLLPAMFMFGLAVAGQRSTPAIEIPPSGRATGPLLMALAAAFALFDYRAIADVYLPPPDAAPQEQRIARARQSLLFGQFADRFAGTLAPAGARPLAVYKEVMFEMIDPRLLYSWAQAHAENGHMDEARFLAARLREFDSPAAQRYFANCRAEPDQFQCGKDTSRYDLRAMRK